MYIYTVHKCNIVQLNVSCALRYTGKWFTALNVMPLTATSAKVFWKTLHHREVQPYFFSFSLLQSDTKSQAFLRMLRKKSDATVSAQWRGGGGGGGEGYINEANLLQSCTECMYCMVHCLCFDISIGYCVMHKS